MKQSIWFKNYSGDGRVLNAYKCAAAKTVRMRNDTCEKMASRIGVEIIRRGFEKNMFLTPPAFGLDQQMFKATKKLIGTIRDLKKGDPCFDYLVAVADSVNYGFKSIPLDLLANLPNSTEWEKEKSELDLLMFQRFSL